MQYTLRMNCREFDNNTFVGEDTLEKMAIVHANKLGKLIREWRFDQIKDPFNGDIHVIMHVVTT